MPPGDDVALKDVMGEVTDDGDVKRTAALASPGNASRFVGGTAAGDTLLDGADCGPSPARLKALTVKVYETPGLRPAMRSGDVAVLIGVVAGVDRTV